MKTKTIKTHADIFDNRVAETIEDFKKRFDEVREEFLAAAQKNPSWAIECRGASVARAEAAFKAIVLLKQYLASDQETKKAAAQGLLERLREELIRGATAFPGSDAVNNGVAFSRLLGIRDAVQSLEYLVDHEFIDS